MQVFPFKSSPSSVATALFGPLPTAGTSVADSNGIFCPNFTQSMQFSWSRLHSTFASLSLMKQSVTMSPNATKSYFMRAVYQNFFGGRQRQYDNMREQVGIEKNEPSKATRFAGIEEILPPSWPCL